MGFEEIRAGLAKYIIKERRDSELINDGNDLFYVYAHYLTTEPDVLVMIFANKVNAKLFCEALNAENECREADWAKYGNKEGKWIYQDNDYEPYFCSLCKAGNDCGWDNYCHNCGAWMSEAD